MKKRPALKGSFTVLVVPSSSITQREITIPTTVHPVDGWLPVVGRAERGSVECSPWAYTPANKRKTVKALRDLATWIENGHITPF